MDGSKASLAEWRKIGQLSGALPCKGRQVFSKRKSSRPKVSRKVALEKPCQGGNFARIVATFVCLKITRERDIFLKYRIVLLFFSFFFVCRLEEKKKKNYGIDKRDNWRLVSLGYAIQVYFESRGNYEESFFRLEKWKTLIRNGGKGFEQYECTIEIFLRVYSDSIGSLRYRKLAFTTLTKLASRKIQSISDAGNNWDK